MTRVATRKATGSSKPAGWPHVIEPSDYVQIRKADADLVVFLLAGDADPDHQALMARLRYAAPHRCDTELTRIARNAGRRRRRKGR